MVVWSCDLAAATMEHRRRPDDIDGASLRFEAGLSRLTDRWPGGTIRNEAEVYSGYYTEAASVSQPDLAPETRSSRVCSFRDPRPAPADPHDTSVNLEANDQDT